MQLFHLLELSCWFREKSDLAYHFTLLPSVRAENVTCWYPVPSIVPGAWQILKYLLNEWGSMGVTWINSRKATEMPSWSHRATETYVIARCHLIQKLWSYKTDKIRGKGLIGRLFEPLSIAASLVRCSLIFWLSHHTGNSAHKSALAWKNSALTLTPATWELGKEQTREPWIPLNQGFGVGFGLSAFNNWIWRLTDLLWGGKRKPEFCSVPEGTFGCREHKPTQTSSNKKRRVLGRDMREACGNPTVGSQEHFRFNLMIQSEGVRSLSVSSHLGIAECVTLVKLLSVSGFCLPIWKIGNSESVYPVGLLCRLNEVIQLKHLEHCLIHSKRSITIRLYYNLASRQLLTSHWTA